MEPFMQLALAVANGALTLVVSYVGWKLRKYQAREAERERLEIARSKLQLASSRVVMLRECNHYIRKGYAPIYALDSLSDMYEAYHDCGGNGAVTGIYEEFMRLPHTPPEPPATNATAKGERIQYGPFQCEVRP